MEGKTMSDWQDGYTDGRYFIERPNGADRAAKGMLRPDNQDYADGFRAGAEDATQDKRAA